jgi:hypothetical protein
MKRILIILLCLMPFTLFGQKQFIRNSITSDTIYFYRGVSLLNLPKDITKLNKNNGTATGTLTTAALNVGGRNLTIDSIPLVDGKYTVYDNHGDTISPHINVTDQVDISTIAVMKEDTLTGAGQYASDHRVDLIEADLADYVVGLPATNPVVTDGITLTPGDTTVTAVLGRIVYKSSNNHFYGCISTTATSTPKWKQLDN